MVLKYITLTLHYFEMLLDPTANSNDSFFKIDYSKSSSFITTPLNIYTPHV